MTWVRIDDGFPEHPKVAAIGPLAIAAQVCGLAYAARRLTDGFIPERVALRLITVDGLARPANDRLLDSFEFIKPSDVIGELVMGGLWERVDGGFRIHDYLDYNPSRDQALGRNPRWTPRQASNGGKARMRNGRRDGQGQLLPERDEWPMDRSDRGDAKGADGQFVSAGRTTNAQVAPCVDDENRRSEPASPAPVPQPLNPSQVEPSLTLGGGPGGECASFDQFWQVYPRKVGKRRAESAFRAALGRVANAAAIHEGAAQLAADPNLPAKRFIPYPEKWLNRDGWLDEPLPPQHLDGHVRDRAAEIVRAAMGERGDDGTLAGAGPGGPGAGVLPPP